MTVGSDFVRIELSRRTIAATLTTSTQAVTGDEHKTGPLFDLIGNKARITTRPDLIHLRIAARVQRTSRIACLTITDPHVPALTHPNPVLVKAVVRANLWFKRLMADPKQSIPALAKNSGLPSRYVRQILRLASLAPNITEAILNGQQPPNLQLRHLIRRQPLAWFEQRRVFGFSARKHHRAISVS